MKHIFTLGFPSFMTEFSSGIITLVFNYVILRLTGNLGVAAYGVIANLSLIVVGMFTGIAQGIQPIISLNFGAGRTRDNNVILRYAFVTAFVLGAILYAFFFICATAIIQSFNPENNIELTKMAVYGIKIYFSAFTIMSAEDIYTLACQEVVGISSEITGYNAFGQACSESVSGSGLIISDDGFILTNYHVIEDAYEGGYDISVYTYDSTEYTATIVGVDEESDIAVLKIDATGLNAATLGSSDEMSVGETIYVVGNPLGELTYTMPIYPLSSMVSARAHRGLMIR